MRYSSLWRWDAVAGHWFVPQVQNTFPDQEESLQDLVDGVDRSVGTDFTNTDGNDAIQVCVSFRRGFESRERSKVIARGIDHFSTAERGDHLRRAMAQPLTRNVDPRMTAGLERDDQVA